MSELKISDSVIRQYLKYRNARYTPNDVISDNRDQIYNRFIRAGKDQGVITYIAKDPEFLLAIIPDYEEYRIMRMYAYGGGMFACDVTYKLSKKQHSLVRLGVNSAKTEYPPEPGMDDLSEDDLRALQECRAGGYVFAQTYRMRGDPVNDIPAIPPLGLDWRLNKTAVSEATTVIEDRYEVTTWRAIFTHLGSKTIRDRNRLDFALRNMAALAQAEDVIDRLHQALRHPDYEYKYTDQNTPPNGYYWEENITSASGYSKPKLFAWRRKVNRPVADVEGVWMSPQAFVNLMNPVQFGKVYGATLPAGMAGVDFADGCVAMINWYGKLTYQLRDQDGTIGEEKEWTKETHLPINKSAMIHAIQTFNKAE